jgi:hypothetical protein
MLIPKLKGLGIWKSGNVNAGLPEIEEVEDIVGRILGLAEYWAWQKIVEV